MEGGGFVTARGLASAGNSFGYCDSSPAAGPSDRDFVIVGFQVLILQHSRK